MQKLISSQSPRRCFAFPCLVAIKMKLWYYSGKMVGLWHYVLTVNSTRLWASHLYRSRILEVHTRFPAFLRDLQDLTASTAPKLNTFTNKYQQMIFFDERWATFGKRWTNIYEHSVDFFYNRTGDKFDEFDNKIWSTFGLASTIAMSRFLLSRPAMPRTCMAGL